MRTMPKPTGAALRGHSLVLAAPPSVQEARKAHPMIGTSQNVDGPHDALTNIYEGVRQIGRLS